jgi:hypothetical protein
VPREQAVTPTPEDATERRPVAVELYCRAATAAAVPLDRHHRRLTRLSRAGVVDSVTVRTWDGRVTLDAVADGPDGAPDAAVDDRERAVRAFRAFSKWADREEVTLAPAFGRREHESAFTGETGVTLRLPVVGMAVRAGEELRAVYPHHDDGPVTVEEGVRRLAAEEPDPVGEPAVSRSAGD